MYHIILFSQHNHEVGFIFFPSLSRGGGREREIGGGERIREKERERKGDEEEEEEE